MAKYVIDGATLTAIADAIRTKAPLNWGGSPVMPEEIPDAISDVYGEGYADGQADGGGGTPSTVTDLTGTIWKLKSSLVKLPSVNPYYIDFTSNGNTFTAITYTIASLGGYTNIQYGGTDGTYTQVYAGMKSKWVHYNYRLMEISGGTDATNTALIDWLYANGELLSAETAGDLEAIGVLCDWQVTMDSASNATITIVNYHPSYYLHCDVTDTMDGEVYTIVVSPEDSDSYIANGYAGGESIYVMNVRWKASAT